MPKQNNTDIASASNGSTPPRRKSISGHSPHTHNRDISNSEHSTKTSHSHCSSISKVTVISTDGAGNDRNIIGNIISRLAKTLGIHPDLESSPYNDIPIGRDLVQPNKFTTTQDHQLQHNMSGRVSNDPNIINFLKDEKFTDFFTFEISEDQNPNAVQVNLNFTLKNIFIHMNNALFSTTHSNINIPDDTRVMYAIDFYNSEFQYNPDPKNRSMHFTPIYEAKGLRALENFRLAESLPEFKYENTDFIITEATTFKEINEHLEQCKSKLLQHHADQMEALQLLDDDHAGGRKTGLPLTKKNIAQLGDDSNRARFLSNASQRSNQTVQSKRSNISVSTRCHCNIQ